MTKAHLYIDGEYQGKISNPEKFVEEIRKLRREGKLPKEINIAYLPFKEEVRITMDSGRVRRPLIVVENGKPKLTKDHIEKLRKGEISWNDLVEMGVIEYLDAEEEENALIAAKPEDVTEKHTHLELHPSVILGLHASLIPYAEFDRGDRVNYGAKMSGQAIAVYSTNYPTRTDTKSNVLIYGQIPLVQTYTYDVFNFKQHPNGQNVVIAVVSHGYNMQDAIVFNKSSIQRGLFWNYMFRTYEAVENRYVSGQEDKIGIPQPGVKGYLGEDAYKHLDEDGIIPPETEVKSDQVLIGRVSPLRFLGKADEFITGIENLRETSVKLRHRDKGVVDRVFITQTSEGNKMVKVVVRDLKIPEIGDKFATRHGQKGVIGALVPQENMPFTSQGIVPDVIFNPHGIPSRMTAGQLLEIIAGKVGALKGKIIKSSAFDPVREEDLSKMLKDLGFREDSREVMYDPRTGRMYNVRIFVGVVFYMKLDHLVSNKLHARARGPVTLLTKQPTEGRAKEGGLRLGEMEKDVLIAHGAAITLKERFDSDKTKVPICVNCGVVAVKDHIRNRYICPLCKDDDVVEIEMSYAFKLLLDELMSMMIFPKLKVDKDLEKIVGVEFRVLDPETIKKMSFAKITKIDLYDEEGYPIEGGIMDPRLGTVDPGLRCRTCGGRFGQCPGHFGYIELAKPVINPLFIKHIYNLLRVTCKKCGRIMYKESQIKNGKINFAELVKNPPTTCPHCNAKQPKVKLLKPYTFKFDDEEVSPQRIREIFEKIPDEDLKLIGIRSRPEWFIVTLLPIPPVTMRPSITLENGERSEDDLTHKLVDIVRINERLKETLELGAPDFIIKDLWELLQYHTATYFDNELSGIPPARHRSGRVLKTLAQRLKTKEGRFRHNLLGKRVNFSARTVISPDPFIGINEVGVPEEIAKELTVPEVANEENLDFLKKLILNGPNKWPGANYVLRPDGIRLKITEKNKEMIAEQLEPGFIVERHLMDGDVTLFNRQPSLHRMSMMAHKARIFKSKTFRLNLAVCTPYNADFDGDEMNLHVPQSKEAMAETEMLMSVEKHIRSPRYSGPIIALIHDHISGLFLLTYGERKIKYEDAVLLVRMVNREVEIPKKKYLTGKEIFSLFIPDEISIETKGKLSALKEEAEKEGKVIIKNGKLVQGAIDKATVGENGVLIDVIEKKYGPYFAKEFIENITKLALYFLSFHGFSISLADYKLPKEIKKKIREILRRGNKEVNKLINEYREGKLQLLIGRTPKESLEQLINREINKMITEINNLVIENVKRDTEVFVMSASGARGSLVNFVQMSGVIGQERIMGERIERGYWLRVFPHFERGVISLDAKGFVSRGFVDGLNVFEFFFDAMNSREGLMDKSVKTRHSGYMERRLIGALQDLVVEYDGTVRDSGGKIIQFLAGEDGLDPSKIRRGGIDVEEIARDL